MAYDVMIRNCDTGFYLMAVYKGHIKTVAPILFASKSSEGVLFENEDEAQATIDFISNVIDFETAECLEIVIVP